MVGSVHAVKPYSGKDQLNIPPTNAQMITEFSYNDKLKLIIVYNF